MTDLIVNPDAYLDSSPPIAFSSGTAATAFAHLADASDSTYIDLGNGTLDGGDYKFSLADPALPADEFVYGIALQLRVSTQAGDSNPNGLVNVHLSIDGEPGVLTQQLIATGSAVTSRMEFYVSPRGDKWKIEDLPKLQVRLESAAGFGSNPAARYRSRVYRAYIEVWGNEYASAVITNPDTVEEFTRQPIITWTYSDPEFAQMERYQVKVFDQATTLEDDFDPQVTAAVYDSGVKFPVGTVNSGDSYSETVDADLVGAGPFVAYVFVAEAYGNGFFSTANAGVETFTIDIEGPGIPVFDATADVDRVRLDINAPSNLLSAGASDFESGDAEDYWASRKNAEITTGTTIDAPHGDDYMIFAAFFAADAEAWTLPNMSLVVPGQEINVGMKVHQGDAMVTPRDVQAGVVFFDEFGGYLSEEWGTAAPVNATWQDFEVSATAPDVQQSMQFDSPGSYSLVPPYGGARFAVAVVRIVGGGAGENVFVDMAYLGSITEWSPGGIGPARVLQVQRSADGGVTWKDVRNLSSADATAGVDFVAYDYEGERGVELQYRARASALIGSIDVFSDWAYDTVMLDRLPSARLVAAAPSLDVEPIAMRICLIEGVDSDMPLDKDAIYVIGERLAVPRSGTRKGEQWDLRFDLLNDAEWATLQTLFDEVAVLWQSPFGEDALQWWVVFIGTAAIKYQTSADMQTNQRRIVSVKALEVGEP